MNSMSLPPEQNIPNHLEKGKNMKHVRGNLFPVYIVTVLHTFGRDLMNNYGAVKLIFFLMNYAYFKL